MQFTKMITMITHGFVCNEWTSSCRNIWEEYSSGNIQLEWVGYRFRTQLTMTYFYDLAGIKHQCDGIWIKAQLALRTRPLLYNAKCCWFFSQISQITTTMRGICICSIRDFMFSVKFLFEVKFIVRCFSGGLKYYQGIERLKVFAKIPHANLRHPEHSSGLNN